MRVIDETANAMHISAKLGRIGAHLTFWYSVSGNAYFPYARATYNNDLGPINPATKVKRPLSTSNV